MIIGGIDLAELQVRPAAVSTLDPAPSWAAWNHAGVGLWPCPEELDVNLNEVAGAEWIDDAGRRARDRLRDTEAESVIGHCDWLAGNLRWSGDALLVVHDWDSMTADSDAVLVGFAAALYSTVSADELATVEDTERFLVVYCHARGQEFSAGELERRGRLASGPGPTTPSISTRSGNPSPRCPRMRPLERLRRTGTGSRRP